MQIKPTQLQSSRQHALLSCGTGRIAQNPVALQLYTLSSHRKLLPGHVETTPLLRLTYRRLALEEVIG